MSRGIEKLIRRMVAPNADVRCLASEALDDPYWVPKEALKTIQKASHRMAIRSYHTASFANHITYSYRQVGESFTSRSFGYEHRC